MVEIIKTLQYHPRQSIHTYRVKKQLEFPAATSPLGHTLHYLDCQNFRHLSARKT